MTTREGERWLLVNGIEHWCRVTGATDPLALIVAIHGGPGGNHYVFERTIGPRLETFATVIYYEQRGCGRSASPRDPDDYSLPLLVQDLEALRSALDVEWFVPLGYSFGAELAAEYTLAHPDRVTRQILQALGTEPDAGARSQLEGFLEVATGEVRERVKQIVSSAGSLGDKVERIWSVVDTATVDRFLFESSHVATVNRTLWRESGLTNTGEIERALQRRAKERAALRERLPSIRVPTLVLVGGHDRNVGVDASRDAAALIPGAQLEVFGRSAHFPDLEEPEAYTALVRGFLEAERAAPKTVAISRRAAADS